MRMLVVRVHPPQLLVTPCEPSGPRGVLAPSVLHARIQSVRSWSHPADVQCGVEPEHEAPELVALVTAQRGRELSEPRAGENAESSRAKSSAFDAGM